MTQVEYFSEADRYSSDIKYLLQAADEEFVPPLSSRSGTTQTDSLDEKINDVIEDYHEQCMKQKFILTIEDGEAIGFLSFREGYNPDVLDEFTPSSYVSTVIVHPEHRRQGYARQMYQELLTNIPEAVLEQYVTTRTWDANQSHINLLNELGFKKIKTIPDDRGEGIDTVYFGIDASKYRDGGQE